MQPHVRRARDAASALLRHPLYGPGVRSGCLVAAAAILETVLVATSRLPEAAFHRATFIDGPVRNLASHGLDGILVLAACVGLAGWALRTRSLGPAWSEFEHVARLRWLVGILAGLLAWVFATYDLNFYLDRSHWVERALLVTIVPLVLWRPAFTILFLLAVLTVGAQFEHPIGGYSWAPSMLPVRVLILFTAFWGFRAVTKRVRTADFVFVLLCLIAAHYWVSGWEKLGLRWIAQDRIGLLLASTYANGWLGFLEPVTLSSAVSALLVLNVPMKVFTLAVECGALLLLWRRRIVRWFLIAAILFHAGIFSVTGIGFWQWVVVDALVLFLFFRRDSPPLQIFTQPRFALSIVIIAGGALWFRPQPLAWLDARATYTYRFEAVGRNGRQHPLTPSFFSPYDYQFTLGAFRYLVDAPRMPITWGATGDRRLAAELNRASTAEEVLEIEKAMGRVSFDSTRAAAFDEFMRRFVTHWQDHDGRGRGPFPLAAPATLWTFPRRDPALGGEAIERVLVFEILSFFDGRQYSEIRRRVVREIVIF